MHYCQYNVFDQSELKIMVCENKIDKFCALLYTTSFEMWQLAFYIYFHLL